MHMRSIVFSLGMAVWLAGGVLADGLIYQLPPDGTAVVYEIKGKNENADREMEGTVTISSVGQTTKDGAKGRWLEVHFAVSNGGREQVILAKIHVLEKHLTRGESPFDNFTKLWMKMGDQAPTEITDVKDRRVGPLPAFLGGPLKEAKKLPAAKIKSGLGELQCEGLRGKSNLDTGPQQVTIQMENRLHKRAPFGVVASTMKFEVSRDGEVRESGEFTLRLKEVKMNAQSQLPDIK